jgi:hypothetical protein
MFQKLTPTEDKMALTLTLSQRERESFTAQNAIA